eukprot:1190463-Prorocentrum_minimum.AAC.1
MPPPEAIRGTPYYYSSITFPNLGPRPPLDGQVHRWKRQYESSAVGAGVTPLMGQLAAWLQAHLPPDPPRPFVVHGDFRLDNLVFNPRAAKVRD